MDIATIQTTIATWVKEITALPTHWENQPDGTIRVKLAATIVLTGPQNIEPVGVDYLQWDDDGLGTVVGHREFDVMLRVISRSQAGNKSAQFYLERLRAALTRKSATDYFGAAGIAVLFASKGVSFDAPFEERWESIASMTLRLTAVIMDADDAPVGVLTRVGLSSNIEGADGDLLPVPPNLDDFEISG